jgi:hypothetical protein
VDVTQRSLAFGLAATVLCVLGGAGCGGGEAADRGARANVAASCAFVVEYGGHRYLGSAAPVGPVEGKLLGTATMPGCEDTPNAPVPDDAEVEVAEIEGVDREIAIMIRGRDETVLLREDVDPQRLPPQLTRLLSAPRCTSGAQPVEVSGRWFGIVGADGHTELDLDPPYDVRIRVSEASVAAYERAEINIRVPMALGRPLTRSDIESSLWEGGTLKATVSCRDGSFVASSVTAAPPA